VRECYMLSGETDFLLKCVAPDLTAFHELVEELTAAPNVASVKTTLVIRRVKFEPGVPIALGQKRPADHGTGAGPGRGPGSDSGRKRQG
jgi:hypothetical protein